MTGSEDDIQNPDQDPQTLRCAVDATGKIVFASPGFAWALGATSAALKGQPISDVMNFMPGSGQDFDPSNLQPGDYDVALKRQGRDPQLLRARVDQISSKPGQNVTVLSFESLHGNQLDSEIDLEEITRQILSAEEATDDVSEVTPPQKELQAELERREQQLADAQRLARMGHWRWVVGEKEISWSEQIFHIFGVEPKSFIPTFENVNARLAKKDVGRIYQIFQTALKEKEDYVFEFRLCLPSGEKRYIHCEGRCELNSDNGEVVALFGFMQDITDSRMHETALREAKDAAESAYAAKTRFLANMSHELRTPLNAIIGFSEMIERQLLGPIGNERYLDYIAGIRESGEHLLDLITDILDMSKIESGKYELQLETLNVIKTIGLAIHMMEGRAHESQVTLKTDNLAPNLHVMADRRAMMQVLLNLLSNAIKFTEAGGVVEISSEKRRDKIVITVSDNGIGIPPEKIGTVTKPFEQVDTELTRKHEGTGLGLTITKDLVELHKGRLEIHSQLGKGTSVSIFLPEDMTQIAGQSQSTAA